MSGRYEKEKKIKEKIEKRLVNQPEIITDYYYSLIGSGKSYVTAFSYIDYVIKFLDFTFPFGIPEKFYKSITSSNINRYIASIRTKKTKTGIKKTSDSLMTCQWSALNSFFGFLIPDYIKENPVSKTERPKMRDNPDVTYLNENEIATMLNNVKNDFKSNFINRDLAILKLGFATGLRISAIVQIDISDIDFDNNVIKVTEKGDRDYFVKIGSNLKNQILLWIKDRNVRFSNIGTDALFVSQERRRISPRTVRDILEKYSFNIGKHVTPHVMRHSCATCLYEKTNDIYLCASQLHHRNVSTTQRYAEISEKNKKKATDLLDNII